jgi:hypothetical protein
VLTGCATKTEGTATFAGPSVSTPSKVPSSGSSSAVPSSSAPTAGPSDEPSDVPSSEVPSTQAPMSEGAPTSRTSGKVNLDDDGAICELISPAQLQKIWHQTPRTFPDSSGPGCTYKDADGNQIIISEYDNLVPSQMAKEDKLDDQKEVKTTVAGHPALVTLSENSFGQGDWYVSEGHDLNADGVVGAILSSDPTLQKEAKAMLTLVVPKYAH